MSTLAHHLPESEHQYGGTHGADYNPRGVAARVAGLNFAQLAAGFAGDAGYTVHCAVNHAFVYHVPEYVRRNPEQRLDDCSVIKLVHIIFVQNERVGPAQAFCQFFWRLRALDVEPPGNEQTRERDEYRPAGERMKQHYSGRFHGFWRALDARRRVHGEDGMQELVEIFRATDEVRRGCPSADSREDRKQNQRHRHVVRRFVHVHLMFVEARLAEKGEENQAEHVERSEAGADKTEHPEPDV